MFSSCILLLLVEVERFNILWDPVSWICTNDSKTLIIILIRNRFCNKVVVHRHRWILMKQLPLDGNNSTDYFQKITLTYVEFVGTCSWPALFLVVVELVALHVRTDSETSNIYTHNSLSTLWKIIFWESLPQIPYPASPYPQCGQEESSITWFSSAFSDIALVFETRAL